jgi:uncharacterized protein
VIFIDTSCILALLDQDDPGHLVAKDLWLDCIEQGLQLVTTNYVVLESFALVQNRLGMAAVRVFQKEIVPLLDVYWVQPERHNLAVTALLSANRRQLSLVDCTSFVVMREFRIDRAFAFDHHFAEQGFTLLPQEEI